MYKLYAVVAVLVALTGCAMTPEPPPDSDYGVEPAGYQDDARERITSVLKDPDSAKIKFNKPVRAYRHGKLGGIDWTGHLVIVDVNAKNSYGGYTGYKEWWFLYSGDHLHEMISPDGFGRPRVRLASGEKAY